MTERRRKHRRLKSKKFSGDRCGTERRRGERRKEQRVTAEIMVEVGTSGRRTYRRTANISMGGVGFHAPIPFRKGSKVELTLRLIGRDEPVRVTGEVVGVDRQGRGNRVRFVRIPPRARRILQNHLLVFKAPTVIGVPLAPLPPEKTAKKNRVREGLLIVQGAEIQEFRIRSSDKIIGRNPKNADIVLDHPSVSRRHAHIYLHHNRHVIADLSSTNGVHFKNMPIHSLVLKDGMIFKVGKVKLQYLVTRMV
jgi:hypothetical protein